MSNFKDVAEFHAKFGLPTASQLGLQTFDSKLRHPQLLPEKEFEFRTAFLFEEIREMLVAQGEKDLPKVADAIVDAVYILLGTAHFMGLPFDELWNAVHRANMQKRPWQEGDPIKPRNAAGLDIVKPPGWQGPNIERIIATYSQDPPEFQIQPGESLLEFRSRVAAEVLNRFSQPASHPRGCQCNACFRLV